MGWVNRSGDEATGHWCEPPESYTTERDHTFRAPIGTHGDLWRCDDCAKLWRIGRACDVCDQWNVQGPHVGQHVIGDLWRPARIGQRIRYVRRGR